MKTAGPIISLIGRALISAGILIFLFAIFQLWGTGVYTSGEQSSLRSQFEKKLETPTTTTSPNAPVEPTAPVPATVPGDAVGIIRIPKIGLDSVIVQGVATADLRRGPGHFPETVMPGYIGNAAIAGHRTTYGAPFHRLDELAPGDEIEITTVDGTFKYRLSDAPFVVSPSQVSVLENTPQPTLTLSTCNPKYSAAQRMIVKATLVAGASPAPQTPIATPSSTEEAAREAATAKTAIEEGFEGHRGPFEPVAWWALIGAIIGGGWWLVFHRYRCIPAWAGGAAIFGLVLWRLFYHLENFLPANF